MVTPPTFTGSSTACGVRAPVLPTVTTMSLSRVRPASGSNLYAMAHRGAFCTAPSLSCCSRESTLTTTPSTWKSSASRFLAHRPHSSITESMSPCTVWGFTRSP
mgnify:CR=1 FL=1